MLKKRRVAVRRNIPSGSPVGEWFCLRLQFSVCTSYFCRADTLLGVHTLVRTNNRYKGHAYGHFMLKPLVTRETMMRKYMSESEFYFFFVHGHHMQLWINAGNEATLLEWMVGGW